MHSHAVVLHEPLHLWTQISRVRALTLYDVYARSCAQWRSIFRLASLMDTSPANTSHTLVTACQLLHHD